MQMDMGAPQIREEYSLFKRLSKSPNLKDSEAFQYEYARFASFAKWPEENDINFLQTAKAGLYYTGVEKRITCFSCSSSFNAANPRDDPLTIHNSRSPSCLLLSNTDTLNKPCWVSDDEGSDVDDSISDLGNESNAVASPSTSVLNDITPEVESSSHSDLPDLTQVINVNVSSQQPSQSAQAESAAVENVHSTIVSPPVTSLPEVSQPGSGEFTHRSVSPQADSLPANTPSVLRDQDAATSAHSDSPGEARGIEQGRRGSSEEPSPTRNMFQEEMRLRSFANWPASAKVRAADLARLGFSYMGQMDKTQCAFCHRVLMKWEEGDDIKAEHRKYSETCPFLNGTETRNIPILSQRTHVANTESPTQSNAGRQGVQAMQRSQGAVTLTRRPMTSESQATRAMHPEHADYNQRLASFQQNPEWHSTNVSAQSLADAGFYFAGFGDNVRCHFCDGGLRNWEKDDDPWVEHARWFTRCSYLLTKKGASFIEDVRQRYPVSRPTQEPEVQETSEQPEPLHNLPLNVNFRKEAQEMGFTNDQILAAVKKEVDTKGHTFLDMLSLVHALLALIPEGQDQAAAADRQPLPCNNRKDEADKERVSLMQVKSKKNKKKKKKGGANGDSQPQAQTLITPTTEHIPEDDDESRSLQEENRQLKEQRMCKVCMDEEVNIVFLPCGHLVACANCAPALRACPICRALIRGSLRTYLS